MDELQALFVDEGAKLTVLENSRQAILAEMAERKKKADVSQIVAAMTPEQLDAVRFVLDQKAVTP